MFFRGKISCQYSIKCHTTIGSENIVRIVMEIISILVNNRVVDQTHHIFERLQMLNPHTTALPVVTRELVLPVIIDDERIAPSIAKWDIVLNILITGEYDDRAEKWGDIHKITFMSGSENADNEPSRTVLAMFNTLFSEILHIYIREYIEEYGKEPEHLIIDLPLP